MAVTFDFSDSAVLVTGGSNGIGLGIARAFRTAGAAVTITGTRERADAYEHDLSGFTYRQCQMADSDAVDALASETERCDILVNNAGQNLPGGRSEYNPDVFDEVLAVNLSAPFRLANRLLDRIAASGLDGGGSVINVGSMSSFFGIEIVPGYGAAKAGVVQMTKTLAVAWAKHGVRVNAVAPGMTETNMTAPMMAFDVMTAPLLARTPMQRFGTPDDVAPVVLFLTSGAARYITGQTLPVDGGFSVQG